MGVSIIQPIVNYSMPNKWSICTSEMHHTYDWERNDWAALPLGVKLAKLVKFDALPVPFSGAYEHNFAYDYVETAWTFNFPVKFLLLI